LSLVGQRRVSRPELFIENKVEARRFTSFFMREPAQPLNFELPCHDESDWGNKLPQELILALNSLELPAEHRAEIECRHDLILFRTAETDS